MAAQHIQRHPKHKYKISPSTGTRLPSKQELKRKLLSLEKEKQRLYVLLAEHDLPLEGQL